MSGMDLVEFLNARLDEDERESQPEPERPYVGGWHKSGCDTYCYDPVECDCDLPARVLADVAAKRAILNYHTQVPAEGLVPNPGYGCQLCACDSLWYVQPEGYCPTIRALALPYADHPDYRQEWAL